MFIDIIVHKFMVIEKLVLDAEKQNPHIQYFIPKTVVKMDDIVYVKPVGVKNNDILSNGI